MTSVDLDETDERILSMLHEDARTPNDAIADAVGLPVEEVDARVERLQDEGVITGFTTMIDTSKLDYISVAFGFSAEPGETDDIAETLSQYENIYKVWILSGRHNLIAHADFADITEFQEFSSNVLHDIDGITNYESSIATKSVVEEGSVVLSTDR